jgi:hypothetical protein
MSEPKPTDVCRWCGQTYAEHALYMQSARMPCLGLKKRVWRMVRVMSTSSVCVSTDPFLKNWSLQRLSSSSSDSGKMKRLRCNQCSAISERIDAGVVLDIGLVKSVQRLLETNGADKAQLVRTVGEMRNRNQAPGA